MRIIRGMLAPVRITNIVGLIISLSRDLEKAVEDLSELLEQPIEADDIPLLRQKMTDKTVCAEGKHPLSN